MLLPGTYLIVLNIYISIFYGDHDTLKNIDALKGLNCTKKHPSMQRSNRQ